MPTLLLKQNDRRLVVFSWTFPLEFPRLTWYVHPWYLRWYPSPASVHGIATCQSPTWEQPAHTHTHWWLPRRVCSMIQTAKSQGFHRNSRERQRCVINYKVFSRWIVKHVLPDGCSIHNFLQKQIDRFYSYTQGQWISIEIQSYLQLASDL